MLDPEDEPVCIHSLAERVGACNEDACPICLEDKLRGLQLSMSVTPMAYKMLENENKILWKVISILAGKGP
jgi:hypothetical protein